MVFSLQHPLKRSWHAPWTPPLLVALLACAVLLPNLAHGTIAIWDEALYGATTRFMQLHRSLLIPVQEDGTFWGWYGKPPLVNWLIMGSTAIFGPTNLGLRLPFALSAVGIVVMAYLWGVELGNRSTGFLTAFLVVCSARFVELGRIATIETPLIAFTLLGLYCYARSFAGPRLLPLGAGLAFAAALLTKQAMAGLALPALLVLELIGWRRDEAPGRWRRSARRLALTAGAAIAGAGWWFAYAYHRLGPEFLHHYLGYHVAERLGASERVPTSEIDRQLALVGAAPIAFVLAIVGALGAWRASRSHPRSAARMAVGAMGSYALTTLILLTRLSPRNLDWYYLHLVPMVALGTAWLLRGHLALGRHRGDGAGVVVCWLLIFELMRPHFELIELLIAYLVLHAAATLGRRLSTRALSWAPRAELLLLAGCALFSTLQRPTFREPRGELDELAAWASKLGPRETHVSSAIHRSLALNYYLGPPLHAYDPARGPVVPRRDRTTLAVGLVVDREGGARADAHTFGRYRAFVVRPCGKPPGQRSD